MGSIKGAFAVGGLIAGLVSAPAFADPTALFGNTFQVQVQPGAVLKFYVNADGTYTGVDLQGDAIQGTWTDNGGQFCMNQTTPVPPPAPTGQTAPSNCGSDQLFTVGNSWTLPESDGGSAQASIVAGR